VKLREIVNGLMYILSTGCQWRAIPKDLPPPTPATSDAASATIKTRRSKGSPLDADLGSHSSAD
jgi:transposase